MESGQELLSPQSFGASSNLSNSCSSPQEPGPSLDDLSSLCGSLEKLLLSPEYDYSDAEIVVEGISVGVNRCILAARSQFFHEKCKEQNANSLKDEKPKYLLKDLVPLASIGYEVFMVFLNYLYTGKIKSSPSEVSCCVDNTCAHDACRPAINYAVELMYASSTFQIKELVMVVEVSVCYMYLNLILGLIIEIILVMWFLQQHKAYQI